jgi:hypothetical protein
MQIIPIFNFATILTLTPTISSYFLLISLVLITLHFRINPIFIILRLIIPKHPPTITTFLLPPYIFTWITKYRFLSWLNLSTSTRLLIFFLHLNILATMIKFWYHHPNTRNTILIHRQPSKY